MEKTNNQSVYWAHLIHEGWKMYIAATEKGLCYVGSQNQSFDELSQWAKKYLSYHNLVQNNEELQPYATELIEYLQGERQAFTLPIDLHGTSFQLSVWDALSKIPYGKTYSYSDIAKYIEKPDAIRAVGTAIGANPALITVPCHRVIGKNGALTGYRGGLDMKIALLTLEKVKFNKEDRMTDV
ncbi:MULTISPECIES: methylated-DNA--[protein]-cysteine S-methyltransferase [Priestia]|uniref:methylated-DNA--[protein]-cysteine S-methyltransferase n=1 Tax=Priestia TaxID=2800373 RepID=UPI00232F8409|nr:methylated-DNA--[protein]-cysteine S-methyltransferase [Priestia sp. AB]MDC0705459.1 methylated-DNA--[protein]-cysteine S-methyltransferase [Priestia sp. AB]MED4213072.1 methylated-DNA--[protein]-cysteine S-methyltransferase [Priestia megaterium]